MERDGAGMSRNYNNLTPAETERLSILMEEMAEASQVIGKILRHGFNSFNPNDPGTSNRALLSKEIGHVRYIVGEMCQRGDISGFIMQGEAEERAAKINKYLHHNRFEVKP